MPDNSESKSTPKPESSAKNKMEGPAIDSYFDERHGTKTQIDQTQSSGSTTDMPVLSPLTTDRVFPIRSALKIDQVTRTSSTESILPWTSRGNRVSETNTIREESEESATTVTSSIVSPSSERSYSELLYTSRHTYEQTADGHMVMTSSNDQLQRCEDEPIHTPGAVQGFGAMVVLKVLNDKLEVRMASENSKDVLEYSPKDLFSLDSFCNIMSPDQAGKLWEHAEFALEEDWLESDNTTNEDNNPTMERRVDPDVFSLAIQSPTGQEIKLWCAVHVPENNNNRDQLICEFELEYDQKWPLMTDDLDGSTRDWDPPWTTGVKTNPEEAQKSLTDHHKPLRKVRGKRRRGGGGETEALALYNLTSQIQDQLRSATKLNELLGIMVGLIKELSNFHRVMVYQFDESWNGTVVAELLDPRTSMDYYLGLNFPASDIPAQARMLYQKNKTRILYDRDQLTARMVCRSKEDLENPLDMTHSYLRAMSPIHVQYLRNMQVRASMSISICAFGNLWGLISCHTYGPHGMRVSFPLRRLFRMLTEDIGRNIERLSYESRLHARKLINTVPTEENPSGYIIATSDDLLRLFDADFGMLSIKNETKLLGKPEDSQEALVLLTYLRIRCFNAIVYSREIERDFPDLVNSTGKGFKTISGLLLVPLSAHGADFIVLFRLGQLRKVRWAGNPYEKITKPGSKNLLEPRKSFQVWSETVGGVSKEWTDEQVETASVMCLIYGKFIEVWRQKEAVLQSSQLTKILLANASHEVRTPLNHIINYLEIALEGPLDPEARENLARSHSASLSLIYAINDLLDLTRLEQGQDLVKEENFDISGMIHDLSSLMKVDAARKGLSFDVIIHPGFPKFVKGDQSKVRRAVANVAANAIQYTEEGGVRLELIPNYCCGGNSDQHEEDNDEGVRVDVQIVIQDTGIGMSEAEVDVLFQEFENVEALDFDTMSTASGSSCRSRRSKKTDQDKSTSPSNLPIKNRTNTSPRQSLSSPPSPNFNRPAPSPSRGSTTSSAPNQRMLGLGLAVVARLVRNMGGQLRLKSEKGNGTKFIIQLPFRLPAGHKPEDVERILRESGPMTPPVPQAEGEVWLIDSKRPPPNLGKFPRSQSRDSVRSGKSDGNSSSRSKGSEIDKLVEAFGSTPKQELGPLFQERRTSTSVDRRPSLDVSSACQSASAKHQLTNASSSSPQKAISAPRSPQSPARSTITQSPQFPQPTLPQPPRSLTLNIPKCSVLVAEDDPVNGMLMKKRLQRAGCKVHVAVNGLACVDEFSRRRRSVADGISMRSEYDVILMDMQMPIMDGGTATQRIREIEREVGKPRIPIFAVSASLREESKEDYVDFGFDGWVMKPVDFGRLDKLFAGIYDANRRREEIYVRGEWERGGWFTGNSNFLGERYVATTSKTDWYLRHEDKTLTEPESPAPNQTETNRHGVDGTHDSKSSNIDDSQELSGPKPALDILVQSSAWRSDVGRSESSENRKSWSLQTQERPPLSPRLKPTSPSLLSTNSESRPLSLKRDYLKESGDPEATREYWRYIIQKAKTVARSRYGKLFGS